MLMRGGTNMIILADEPTSALDSNTESIILKNLRDGIKQRKKPISQDKSMWSGGSNNTINRNNSNEYNTLYDSKTNNIEYDKDTKNIRVR